jgi:hypothetical protein
MAGFGFAGAAAGGADALEQIIVRKLREQQIAQEQAMEAQRIAQQSDQFGQSLAFNRERAATGAMQDAADNADRAQQRERQARLDQQAETDRNLARSKENNASGVKRMLVEGLRLRTTTPQDAALTAFGENIEVKPEDLDPEFPQRQRIELENIRSKNNLREIGAHGAESRATASVRAAGTRDSATQRRIDSKAKGFDAQPVVQRAQTLAEAAAFAASLNDNTTNPADDQGLIYNFAKSMDPDSAVRDGEYATIQKYAQSLAERYGFNAARVFSNTAFLTPEARRQLKATIVSRFQATRGQYDALRKTYTEQITGMGGDDADLVDYGAGWPAASPQTGGGGAVQEWTRDAQGRPVPVRR